MSRTTPEQPIVFTPEERKFLEARADGSTVEEAARKARRSRRWAYYTLNRYRRRALSPARAN